jgi:hypothetical protein
VHRWTIDKEILQSRFLRGLTAVPDPKGGKHQVLIANFEYPGTIARFDPAKGVVTAEQELDIKEFFNQAWNTPAARRRGAIAAYNRFLPVTDPKTGETVWLCGAWVKRPGSPNPPNNGSCYLIRHRDGRYDWATSTTPLIPSPPARNSPAAATSNRRRSPASRAAPSTSAATTAAPVPATTPRGSIAAQFLKPKPVVRCQVVRHEPDHQFPGFPRIGNRNRWFFQALEAFVKVFPSLGKKQRKHFQALDKMRRNSPACGGPSPRLGTDESNESKRNNHETHPHSPHRPAAGATGGAARCRLKTKNHRNQQTETNNRKSTTMEMP